MIHVINRTLNTIITDKWTKHLKNTIPQFCSSPAFAHHPN